MTVNNPLFYIRILLLVSVSLILLSCSTSEPLISPEEEEEIMAEMDREEVSEYLRDEMSEEDYFLFEHRSFLSDRFNLIEHDIPGSFLAEIVQEEREIDESVGYRVQILSTRDVALADSTRDEFRVWASQRIHGHDVDAYIYFRQPYYRVRVGDFRDRRRAVEVSQLLKNRYPEAWVVHDRIEPDRVPADTTEIRIIDLRSLNVD